MSIEIEGNWKKGFAFDVHTLASTYLGVDEFGHDQWENTRSEMGQLVYDLKYRSDKTTIPKIVNLLDKFKGIESMDYIVPIPATKKHRRIQPVLEIAHELGRRKNVTVLDKLLIKQRDAHELKNVTDIEERRAVLKKTLTLSKEYKVSGKNILLMDDLYRSGATLAAATELLYEIGQVKDVYVLTMTKTRSIR